MPHDTGTLITDWPQWWAAWTPKRDRTLTDRQCARCQRTEIEAGEQFWQMNDCECACCSNCWIDRNASGLHPHRFPEEELPQMVFEL